MDRCKDRELLRQYVELDSEHAFRKLVDKHYESVYSAALRRCDGDAHLAKDICQSVFIDLARKSRHLLNHNNVIGSLLKGVHYSALNQGRIKSRRIRREIQSQILDSSPSGFYLDENDLEATQLLDRALNSLERSDREALDLRFHKRLPYKDLGKSIGVSPNTARQRVNRALVKLRKILVKKGKPFSISALIAGMSLRSTASGSSPSLAESVASVALNPGTQLGSITVPNITGIAGLSTQLAMTKIQTTILVVALGTTSYVIHHQNQSISKLKEEHQDLLATIAKMNNAKAVEDENGPIEQKSGRLISDREFDEFMELRGTVALLKNQLKEAKKQSPIDEQGRNQGEVEEAIKEELEEKQKKLGIAVMNYGKRLALGMFMHANESGGYVAQDFETLQPYMPDLSSYSDDLGMKEFKEEISSDQFEIVFKGKITDITNPGSAIIMREKDSWRLVEDSKWNRAYVFADGHVELHTETTKESGFIEWEKEKAAILKEELNQ